MASNKICEEEREDSAVTVLPHLTAVDTDGPQAAPFVRVQSPVLWDFILLELPGRGCTFPTLKPQATRFPQQLLIFWCPKPDAMLRFLLKKKLMTIKCCYSHGTTLKSRWSKKKKDEADYSVAECKTPQCL